MSSWKQKHEHLKERIHNFRIPLSPKGRFVMGCIYCGTPLVAGYMIYRWTKKKADENLGIQVCTLFDFSMRGKNIRWRERERERERERDLIDDMFLGGNHRV